MALRVTRPGFLRGIKAYMKAAKGIDNYDPNTMASRQEMRTFVCGQCHVEYYFKPDGKAVTYDEIKFNDWTHAETGAPASLAPTATCRISARAR